MADALAGLVDYGRVQGLEWWTNRQICQWETARRSVNARFESANDFVLQAASALPQATLLLLRSQPETRSIALNGRPVQAAPWTWHGFEFDAVTADIAGELKVQVG